jgi:hypothetical protein
MRAGRAKGCWAASCETRNVTGDEGGEMCLEAEKSV